MVRLRLIVEKEEPGWPRRKIAWETELRDVEKGREDDYFARRDRELLEKMRKRRRPKTASENELGRKRKKSGAVETAAPR